MVEGSGGASPVGVGEGVGREHSGLLGSGLLFVSVWLIPVVLGAVLGTAGWLVSGWPWWPLVGAVALWSAAFLIPRYWPGLRDDRWSLCTELLVMFAPGKGVARMDAEQERRFRRTAFPLYGLPASYPGGRYLAGSGAPGSRRANAVRWLSLGHGDPRPVPGGTWLIVESAVSRCAPADTVRHRRLAERLWNLEQWATILKGDQPPRTTLPVAPRPDPLWSAVHIAIDDMPVAFEYLADGENWAAWAAHDNLVVSLLASRIPLESVTLATVTDLQPYIDGSRQHAAAACPVPPPQNTRDTERH